MTKLEFSSPERNKKPILEVLRRVLPENGTVLEIGGGSGQHAAYFSDNLHGMKWLTTDVDQERLASIRAWRADLKHPRMLEPCRLDVVDDDWEIGPVDVVFSSNMVHITPWKCCLGLLAGARRHLVQGGLLLFYGPFRIDGEHTAPSNAAFDEDLRGRDPRWGVRDIEAIRDAADGFVLQERIEMPANNQILVFRKT